MSIIPHAARRHPWKSRHDNNFAPCTNRSSRSGLITARSVKRRRLRQCYELNNAMGKNPKGRRRTSPALKEKLIIF